LRKGERNKLELQNDNSSQIEIEKSERDKLGMKSEMCERTEEE